jgi:hypothetical protein
MRKYDGVERVDGGGTIYIIGIMPWSIRLWHALSIGFDTVAM